MGTIELAIPKVRPGTHFPSLLQPRRRAEHALLAVDGISKSEVSRNCGELDVAVTAFRMRPLAGEHRHLWLDSTVSVDLTRQAIKDAPLYDTAAQLARQQEQSI